METSVFANFVIIARNPRLHLYFTIYFGTVVKGANTQTICISFKSFFGLWYLWFVAIVYSLFGVEQMTKLQVLTLCYLYDVNSCEYKLL